MAKHGYKVIESKKINTISKLSLKYEEIKMLLNQNSPKNLNVNILHCSA